MFYKFFTLVFMAIFFLPETSLAYLDPGTGSYILQILAASLVGAIFAIRIFFDRIKNFFSKKREDE